MAYALQNGLTSFLEACGHCGAGGTLVQWIFLLTNCLSCVLAIPARIAADFARAKPVAPMRGGVSYFCNQRGPLPFEPNPFLLRPTLRADR